VGGVREKVNSSQLQELTFFLIAEIDFASCKNENFRTS